MGGASDFGASDAKSGVGFSSDSFALVSGANAPATALSNAASTAANAALNSPSLSFAST